MFARLLLICFAALLAPSLSRADAAAPATAHSKVYLPMQLRDSALQTMAAGTVALGSYRPAFPNDLSGATTLEQASDRRLGLVHWYALWGGWKREFSRADLDAVAQRGSVPMITWEPWAGTPNDPAWSLRDAVLSGKNDAYVDNWARGMAAYGKPVVLRFAHEMHDSSYPWALGVNGNSASEYVAAWQHVRAIFARYDTGNVKWVWNPNTMGDATASAYAPLYRALYPGDGAVDYVGLDIYNTGPNLDWGAPRWRSFGQVLAEPYAALAEVSDKPLILAEVGSTEVGGSKPDWIADALSAATAAQFPRLRAIVWFDVSKEQPWQVASSTESLRAWAGAAHAAVFDGDPLALLTSPID